MSASLAWYVRRLRKMGPREVVTRARDLARQQAWARRQVRPGQPVGEPPGLRYPRTFAATIPDGTRDRVPETARTALLHTAEALLAGRWDVLATTRTDLAAPDWFHDPVTGRSSPRSDLAFRIDHRDEDVTGNVKSVWELSRHHHLTVLAAAYWLTGDERYAERVDHQLRSWWEANPNLSGIHWTSGIELGVRLLSWVWVRRLLDDWPKVADLFESNEVALAQIRWHQEYLAAFRSGGSSGNNHLVLEAAGRLAAASAFPWFAESDQWRRDAVTQFESAFGANTFDSGVNRELATDYHRFVTEAAALVAAEAAAGGSPLGSRTWERVVASFDVAAAVVDGAGHPPRQGDGDEGRALQVDAPALDTWGLLLDTGRHVAGALPWWPPTEGSVLGTVLGALAGGPRTVDGRPRTRPAHYSDAGLTILRSTADDGPELWCRCDGGPHGFGSLAAHGHADALSIEVRYDGTEVLVDPGTYCYHGEPEWRSYFRSTRAHNTVEVDGRGQSLEGGPFLWRTQAATVVDDVGTDDPRDLRWTAHHDGYADLEHPVGHRRSVRLDPAGRRLVVVDELSSTGSHDVAVWFHVGPLVEARLEGHAAHLSWTGAGSAGREEHAVLDLPAGLTWTAHRGETHPPLGWCSPRFGVRVPTTSLVGRGTFDRTASLTTVLDVDRVPGPRSAP